jgi:hypothetical protein
LPAAKSIYPPLADSNRNSAIPGAALRAQSGILADFWPWILPAAKSIYPS